MSTEIDLKYMQLALALAKKGRLTCSPNPMVGCVIVKDGEIISTGYHLYAGAPHAEAMALALAGEKSQGATAYVTLEPCCHHGRTPPCTAALINAGIKRVVVSCIDPNPLVAQKGIQDLKAAGIQVDIGIAQTEATRLNEIFFHYMTTNRPFIIAKWGMSLDGYTQAHDGDRQISNAASQHHAHQLRQQVDAILIGANTAKSDNPLLTTRLADQDRIRHPLRIILSSRGDLPHHLRLFDDAMPGQTLIATTQHVSPIWHAFIKEKKHVDLLICQATPQGRVDILDLVDQLGKRQITSLLVEGGMTVLHDFFQHRLINKTHVYLAPLILGEQKTRLALSNMTINQIDDNFHITADSEETNLCLAALLNASA